jgi:predicted acylesterase/phospholipase RssA
MTDTRPAELPPTAEAPKDRLCWVLIVDGGGAKGFYTLGVLKEIEALIKRPIYERFGLVFGTSTGAIIAALICLGHSVDDRSIVDRHRELCLIFSIAQLERDDIRLVHSRRF